MDLLACTAAIEHLRALCADVKATFSNTEAKSIPICVEVRSALRARAQPQEAPGSRAGHWAVFPQFRQLVP